MDYKKIAQDIIKGIGGKDNIISLQNCVTRLRIELHDSDLVDISRLKQTGAHAVIKNDKHNVQVVIGPEVTNVIIYMKRITGE